MASRSQAKRSKLASQDRPDNDLATVSFPDAFGEGDELEFRDLLALFFAATSAFQAGRRQVARRFDLSATELAVFLAANKLQGMPGIGQIAQHLRVSATNVTTDVNRLVKADLLQKLPDPDDARAVQIGLTRKGSALLKKVAPILRESNDRWFSGLSKGDVTRLRQILERMIAASHEYADELRERWGS